MVEKNIKTRIINKHATEAIWNLTVNFIPKQGEFIVYDKDSAYDYERLKIGDGETDVNSLPFVTDNLELITVNDIDTICATTIQVATANEVTF